jgi:hypothetical protein
MAKQAKQGVRQSNGRFQKKVPTQAIGTSKDNPNAVVPPKPTTSLNDDLINKALASTEDTAPAIDNAKANSSFSTAFVSSWDEKKKDVVQPGYEPDVAPTPVPTPAQPEKKAEPAPAPVAPAPTPTPAPAPVEEASKPVEPVKPAEPEKPVEPVKPVEEAKPVPVVQEVKPVEAPKVDPAPAQPASPVVAPLPPAPENFNRVRPIEKPVSQNSYFDGKPWQVLLNDLLDFFAIVLTLGIAFPWVYCHDLRWEYDHMVYEGKRMHFDGHGSQLIGHWIIWYLLTVITLGIYGWWIPIKLMKWKVKHCHFE